MKLVRMVYASKASKSFNPREIMLVLEASKRNNPKQGVTGLLFLGNKYFFQCLEGPRPAVNRIYNKILTDPRHEDVQILEMRETTGRYFDGWSMKFISLKSIENKFIRQTGLSSFDPYKLDSNGVDELLNAFRQTEHTKEIQISEEERVPVPSTSKGSGFSFFNWFRRRNAAMPTSA
ncbi:MAG: BLUF domain-containing protein [Candidatus Competibacteraceae bacterium]|jgi:hypothetical protein|nr:BLUF domain-containing protein [Candidatus Competibacteraceae bacterium]